jgi:hypothetical protein
MGAKAVLHDIVDDTVAGRRVVAVEVVVGAHGDGEGMRKDSFERLCLVLSTFAGLIDFFFAAEF